MMTHGTTKSPRAGERKPSNGHTCGGCPSHWTGLSVAHCGACHETFSAVGLFDQHRRSGQCVDPATLTGMSRRDGMWRGPEMTDDKRKRFGR